MALHRIPRIGLGHGLFGLSHSQHPFLGILVLILIVVAVYLAARNSRRG